MTLNNSIKTATLASLLLTKHVQAQQRFKVEQLEPKENQAFKELSERGLSCQSIVVSFDGNAILASCRDVEEGGEELGFYTLTSKNGAHSKSLLFKIGDASGTLSFEHHSPATIKNHSQPNSQPNNDERLVIIDVFDEGSCYASEVFRLSEHTFSHVGTVEYSTLTHL